MEEMDQNFSLFKETLIKSVGEKSKNTDFYNKYIQPIINERLDNIKEDLFSHIINEIKINLSLIEAEQENNEKPKV